MNRTIWMFILMITTILFWVLYRYGFHKPPKKISGSDLQEIQYVSGKYDFFYELNDDDIDLWKSLEFSLTTNEYPGETPDYKAFLLSENEKYTVMYNENSNFVFFCFYPDIKYGWFNSPPAEGWSHPLYITSTTDKLLQLIKYEK
jgi:hypothetical protein